MSVLAIENVTKRYRDTLALNNINLSFDAGVYAVLGHNGAGKSTLINILSTTLDYEGSVLYEGKNIVELGADYRKILGYMPQQQSMVPSLTVESFLIYMATMKGLPKATISDRVALMLKMTDLESMRRKALDELSGGMKQRVLIAQASIQFNV